MFILGNSEPYCPALYLIAGAHTDEYIRNICIELYALIISTYAIGKLKCSINTRQKFKTSRTKGIKMEYVHECVCKE